MPESGVRKRMTGVVVGASMNKTVVVLVNRLKKHKTYSKYIRRHSKYLAHDPQNSCHLGDRVKIIESRPISRWKRWRVVEIIEKGELGTLANDNDQLSEQVK